MTITKAIEAAREALKAIASDSRQDADGIWMASTKTHKRDTAIHALAALPEKPMTEDELVCFISREWGNGSRELVQKLKAANALYVE